MTEDSANKQKKATVKPKVEDKPNSTPTTVKPKVEDKPNPVPVIKEMAAAYIASFLIVAFILLMGLPLLFFFSTEGEIATKTTQAVEWLKGVSAVLSGLVGAVVGYYYRSEATKS